MKNRITYEIMHADRCAASINTSGIASVYEEAYMPYALYLETGNDFDTCMNNLQNFYAWCSGRILTLDRTYAKQILNSAGISQAVTDKDRAEIAISYRCASVTDVFWVRTQGEPVQFSQVNLYENHLSNVFMDISLRGRQYTVENQELARDISTSGVFPKAWKRVGNGFRLLKDGEAQAVKRELLASRICRCFKVEQVLYEPDTFDGELVSSCENLTSGEYSIATMEALAIWLANHERDREQFVLSLDEYGYYMMNIIDYLVGNTDRHWGNWGVLVKNQTNRPVSLHKLMDFNQSFSAYDTIEGANCLTELFFGNRMTQKEAALKAVSRVGLNQLQNIENDLFRELPEYYQMFQARLALLQKAAGQKGKRSN